MDSPDEPYDLANARKQRKVARKRRRYRKEEKRTLKKEKFGGMSGGRCQEHNPLLPQIRRFVTHFALLILVID